MKHTKGPWIVESHSKGELEIWNTTEHVAVIPPSLVANRKANARLIASAPELLEMLTRLQSEIDSLGDLNLDGEQLKIDLRSLIAKATGGAE